MPAAMMYVCLTCVGGAIEVGVIFGVWIDRPRDEEVDGRRNADDATATLLVPIVGI